MLLPPNKKYETKPFCPQSTSPRPPFTIYQQTAAEGE